MDDLSAKIGEVLQNPEMMAQIRGLASLLGQSPPDSEPPEKSASQAAPQAAENAFPNEVGTLLSQLLPAVQKFGQETDEMRLLFALRPLLGTERQKKLDRAVRLLKMFRLLPNLKDILPKDLL